MKLILRFTYFLICFICLILPVVARSAGSPSERISCRFIFSSSNKTNFLDTLLLNELQIYQQQNGSIMNSSHVIQFSKKILKRIENESNTESESESFAFSKKISTTTSYEIFLLKKIELYFVQNGIEGILKNQNQLQLSPKFWKKLQKNMENHNTRTISSFFSIITLEPIYRSIIMNTIKIVDDYIAPFTSKDGKIIPYRKLTREDIDINLLHSIVNNGINSEKIQRLYHHFGNGIYAEYATNVALKYLSRLTWALLVVAILDELNEMALQNKIYSFVQYYQSLGKDGLIQEMVRRDNLIGMDSSESYYLELNPYELLREFQDQF